MQANQLSSRSLDPRIGLLTSSDCLSIACSIKVISCSVFGVLLCGVSSHLVRLNRFQDPRVTSQGKSLATRHGSRRSQGTTQDTAVEDHATA